MLLRQRKSEPVRSKSASTTTNVCWTAKVGSLNRSMTLIWSSSFRPLQSTNARWPSGETYVRAGPVPVLAHSVA